VIEEKIERAEEKRKREQLKRKSQGQQGCISQGSQIAEISTGKGSMQIEASWVHFSGSRTASDLHANRGRLGTVPSLICTKSRQGTVVWHEFQGRFLWHNFPDF
jgi:hypothetical protein